MPCAAGNSEAPSEDRHQPFSMILRKVLLASSELIGTFTPPLLPPPLQPNRRGASQSAQGETGQAPLYSAIYLAHAVLAGTEKVSLPGADRTLIMMAWTFEGQALRPFYVLKNRILEGGFEGSPLTKEGAVPGQSPAQEADRAGRGIEQPGSL